MILRRWDTGVIWRANEPFDFVRSGQSLESNQGKPQIANAVALVTSH
jgi:hypothetical protein